MNQTMSIRPLSAPIEAVFRVPGSKSITIRAMACAAMATGRSHIYGALAAEDTQAMARALAGFGVSLDDHGEPWVIDGLGRHLRAPNQPIDAGESGLTARISMVMASLADGGDTTIDGLGRLRERPIRDLVDVLVSQGVAITTTDGFLPVTIGGQSGLWGEEMEVDCSRSSQFATALLIGSPMASRPSVVKLNGLQGSSGYLDVTVDVMEKFGASVEPTITGFDVAATRYESTDFVVEPDASAAVYPMTAAAITSGRVELDGLRATTRQPDMAVAGILEMMGCRLEDGEVGLVIDARGIELQAVDVDLSGSPDGALAVGIACLFASGESRLGGLSSLRHKESDRMAALTAEIGKLGGDIAIEEDSLRISGSSLHAGVVDSHGDHRVAMSLALIGLVTPGIEVSHPEVVNKTWPGFWAAFGAGNTQQSPG